MIVENTNKFTSFRIRITKIYLKYYLVKVYLQIFLNLEAFALAFKEGQKHICLLDESISK